MLYSETETVSDRFIEFVSRETCFLQADAKGQLHIQRADKTMWGMPAITTPWTSVVMFHQVKNPELLASIHSEMSGLVVPKSGLRIAN